MLENKLEDSAFLFRVNPSVWADRSPGRVKNSEPIKIKLKEGAPTARKGQDPLKTEALKGIQTFIQKFKDFGHIRPCWSPYNTPILPVLKPEPQKYRFVQDLQAIKEITEAIHPTVPNPYTY